jgi:Fe2+ or Zn2+ uptake regulation protein
VATQTDSELDRELMYALRAKGHRVTAPRLLVHRHVRARLDHVTAEQVHSELSAKLPSISPATVYATLDLLDELGFVRRMSGPGGITVYDSRVDAHHHLVCRKCGHLVDIDVDVDTAGAERAARAVGFRVDHADLRVSGLCADCAAAA